MIRNWKKAAAVIGALALTAMIVPALSSPASAAVLKPGISSGNGVAPVVANGFPACPTGTTAYLWPTKSPGTNSPQTGVSIKLERTNQSLPGDDSRYVNFQITGAKMVQAIVKTDVFIAGFITESTVYSYAAPGVPDDTRIHPPTASNSSPYRVDGYRFCYVRNVADLSITKAASPASQNPGEAVTYTLTVANAGPDAATGVTVIDTLPQNVTFVSASDGGSLAAGGLVTWGGLTVPAGTSKVLTVNVTVNTDAPGGAALTNSATVTGNETDPNLLNNSANDSGVTVNSLVDVEVQKTVSDPKPNVDDIVTYTITATNVAGNAAATDVTITDTLPAGVTFVSASGGGIEAEGVVTWAGLTVPKGDSVELFVDVTITGAGGTNIVNTATRTAVVPPDTNPGNDSGTASLTVNQAPVAGFTSVVNLLDVQFTDASSDPDGTIETYSWDFGDGTTSALPAPTHPYLASGTYDVKLTVTDNDGGTNTINQPVEVRFEEAVDCGGVVTGDDLATTGPAAQEATFTRGGNNVPGGVTNTCQQIGVTLQIDKDGVFLDKGTVGVNGGTQQDVNSTLLIKWTPLAPSDAAKLNREINFFPGQGGDFDEFVAVQWCESSEVVSLGGQDTLTAVHPVAMDPLLVGAFPPNDEVPWCLVSSTAELIEGKIVQVQLYHGKGDPRMR